MLKQFFNNLFNPKDAKFGFNVDFVNGTLNHNPINKIKAGKCALNFEKQTLTIKQGDVVISDNMNDVESIRTWVFEQRFYFAITTKTYNEYKFLLEDNKYLIDMFSKCMVKYTDALNIPFEYCGKVKENDD